jgi:hypothetical protein
MVLVAKQKTGLEDDRKDYLWRFDVRRGAGVTGVSSRWSHVWLL